MVEYLSSQHPSVRASTCTALGMMGDNVFLFIDKLTKCFKDRCTQVKIALMLALPGLGAKGQMYASAVGQEMYSEDPKVRVAAVTALGEMGTRGAALVEDIADLLGDTDVEVRLTAVKTLGKFGEETAPFLGV